MKTTFSGIFLTVALALTSAASAQTDSVKSYTVKVINLHCDGDMPAIKTQLLNQEGIDDVSFTGRNGTASTFTVTYHSAASSEASIDKSIEATPGCDDKRETPYRVKRERAKSKR